MIKSLALLLAAGFACAAPPFSAEPRVEIGREMGELNYLHIAYGPNTFTLVPPRDWARHAFAQSGRLRFCPPNGYVYLDVQFRTNELQSVLTTADGPRQLAAPHLTSATVVEEFQPGTSEGRTVIFRHSLNGRPMRTRLSIVGFEGGCASFLLTCGADEFKVYEPMVSAAQASFQCKTPPRRQGEISGIKP